MANEQNDQHTNTQNDKAGQSGQRREIGEGMHSLDSTQAPLKAETGEPDWDAMKGRGSSQSENDEQAK